MQCTRCGSEGVIINRKYSGQLLCSDCFIETTRKKVMRDIRKYKLIERGDRVLVGLSGGKDSVMVIDILDELRERNIIELEAVTIDEGIGGYREDGVRIARKICADRGIPHRVVSLEDYAGITLDEIMKNPSRSACTYCGVFRRWILNREARKSKATKIATGHNLDDETQAIVMNYLEGNLENLTRIGPMTSSAGGRFIPKIKPLREIPEKEVALYVLARGLDVHLAGCPYASGSFRREIGDFLKQISVKRPTIMYSTLRGFDRIKEILRRDLSESGRSGICVKCGEPASGKLCKACTFIEELTKR
ncbi:TIGR00269 family protein [Methanothermobacter thermautotrophicus]|nr:TIGR00269 family protein [Methanothermobacter thermautotrophicus]WBF06219.1 TIGR00269 family protein [Methanothermobacter thermautotrophicus]